MPPFTEKAAPYQLFIAKPAFKQLAAIPNQDAEAILIGLEAMCKAGIGSVTPLNHSKRGGYRLRVGKYRAIFNVVAIFEELEPVKGKKKVAPKHLYDEIQVLAIERRNDKIYSNTKR